MGNCLFESLNHYLGESKNYELRLKLVNYIVANPKLFEQDILASGFKSIDEYCEIMTHDGRDGDGIVLQAAVLLYEVTIIVHFPGKKQLLRLDRKDTKTADKECHLIYIPGHYSVIRN